MGKKKVLILVLVFSVAIGMAASFGFANAQTVGVDLPSVPTGMNATVTPQSQVSLSWTGSTESSGTIEGYYIYRNGGQIATTAGTSIIDTSVVSGVYNYQVAAYDENGNVSAQSSPASVTVIADTTPPSVPSGVSIGGATTTNSAYAPTTLTISWTASTDNVGVAGYYVYRNGVQISSSTVAFTGTSLTDTVLPGTYTYTVAAYDAAQNYSNRSVPATVTISVDTTPPSVPAHVSVQQTSATGVNLSWQTSTDNVGVAGYQVFRDGTQIATVAGSPYADTGLSGGNDYAYAVTAYDIAGNVSAKSTPVAVDLQSVVGPSVPYLLSGVFLPTSTVELSWAPSGDVLALTGYSVYRNGVQIGTASSSSYLDEGLATGTYMYYVSATDVSGAVSATSSAVSVVVSVVPTSTASTLPPFVPYGLAPTVTPVAPAFTEFLYAGLRNAQVKDLQSLLAQNGYLSPAYATGFFGSLTESALEKFQCAQSIVCTGGAGWGTVGPKTRAALNKIQGGAAATSTTTVSTPTSASLNAEIQALQAELANLERQIP